MKDLNTIVSEAQGLDTTSLDAVVAGINQLVADLQAYIAANPSAPVADPVVTVTLTTEGGVATVFVPQA